MKNEEFLLDESFKLTDPNTGEEFEKNNEALKKYFNEFNDTYFEGKLQPISLGWFKGTRVHGYFRPRPNVYESKVEGVEIKLNINACGTFAAFRNTFVHEMLHYYRDCVVGFTEAEWDAARRALSYRAITRYRQILNNTAETAHTGIWKKLADEMSLKYPELGNIERYAVQNTETGVAMMDKKYVVDFCLKNVIVKVENSYLGTAYFCISKNNVTLNKIINAIKDGKSASEAGIPDYFRGKWTREWPTLKPEEFTNIRASRDMTRYLKGSRFPKGMIRKEEPIGELK